MKTLDYRFTVPIYNDRVWIYFGSIEEIKKIAKKRTNKHLREHIENHPMEYLGAVHNSGKGNLTILHMIEMPETSFSYGVLQHEIFHLAYSILSSSGIELTKDSEEAYSYLIGYLTETIYNQIKKVMTK